MLAMEDLLSELISEAEEMNNQPGGLPPGFRFHPTDEELITFYLASKVFNGGFSGIQIPEVDLNRCEPWDLPDAAKMGERQWYFFSLRDRKYPTGLRTNRATGAGYWKATGKDREIHSASSGALLGMKKTLVFYRGRAPRGEKTKWVMHEYRLDGDFSCRNSYKEEWVICRIFLKTMEKRNPLLFEGQNHYMQESLPQLLETPTPLLHHPSSISHQNPNFLIKSDQNIINDIKTMINPSNCSPVVVPQSPSGQFFPISAFNPSSIGTNKSPNTDNNRSPSMLIKSLPLSHQDQAVQAVPRQCKTEANFSYFQGARANLRWVDTSHHQDSNIFAFESVIDCYNRCSGDGGGDATGQEVSSVAGIGVDGAIGSWNLDP